MRTSCPGGVKTRDLAKEAHHQSLSGAGACCHLFEDRTHGLVPSHTGLGVHVHGTELSAGGGAPSGEVSLLRCDECRLPHPPSQVESGAPFNSGRGPPHENCHQEKRLPRRHMRRQSTAQQRDTPRRHMQIQRPTSGGGGVAALLSSEAWQSKRIICTVTPFKRYFVFDIKILRGTAIVVIIGVGKCFQQQ